MIPKQEYELVNVCRQTMEEGTPLICDDCGRVIFNIATIKGKMDGKTYNVGMTCVKKLLNKTIYFNFETMLDYERQVSLWNEAWNTRKWIDKQQKQKEKNGQKPYVLTLCEYYSETDKCVYIYVNLQGERLGDHGSTKSIRKEYASVFNGLF